MSNIYILFFSYCDTIIYLPLSQKPPGGTLKKENNFSIFTFFEVFLILFLASHNVENSFYNLEFSKQITLVEIREFSKLGGSRIVKSETSCRFS